MNNNLFNSQLCQKQAELFLLFFDYNYDIESTIKLFMTSEFAYRLDKEYDSYQYQNVYKIFDDFESKYVLDIVKKKNNISRDVVEYIGYLYRFISINKKISSKKIIRICPIKILINNYLLWHTYSFEKVIDLIFLEYKKRRMSHDLYETNNSQSIQIDMLDPHLYSFLGKRILYKLNRDIVIKNLIFNECGYNYLFIDENKIVALEVSFGKDIRYLFDKEVLYIQNKETSYKKKILFIFSENIPKEEDLNFIYNHHYSNKNNFDEIYIYNNKVLYFIDSGNSLIKLPILIKKCDYNIAYKESLKYADE